ncbi:response regulator [Natronomonas marina]|jgi:CheY-like chemotaxis protein|uniref:response regulator n=1 Tax=Natronomonas marina TaxID=2961939 RepID=UPI0020C98428|nr:response regulator [Natronomonas marina]
MTRNDEGGSLEDIPGVGGEVVDGGAAAGAGDVDDVTILFVDDERQLLSVLASNLEEDVEDLEIVTASNATEAIDRLEQLDVDCVVSDYKMPGTDGLDLLERCRDIDPNMPFILFTSKGSEEIASKAINADVTDYLQKDLSGEQLALLSNRIENAVTERRAREAVEDALQHLQRIHDRVSDAYLGLDDSFHITYLDEDAAVLLQDGREQLLGERLWDVLPGAVDSPLQTEFERALTADTSVELETYYEPFEAWFDVRAFPADGGLSVYFRDVTERKRLEEAVEARESDLEDVVDALEEMGEHSEMLLELAEEVGEAYDGDDEADEELVAGVRKLLGGIGSLQSMAAPHDDGA